MGDGAILGAISALSAKIGSGSKIQRTLMFRTVGSTSWVCPTGVTEVELLMVGGGAGGGGGIAGAAAGSFGGGVGGDGGQVVFEPTVAVTPGSSYSMVIGDGGVGADNDNAPFPQNGQPSSAFGFTAAGGTAITTSTTNHPLTSNGGSGAYWNGANPALSSPDSMLMIPAQNGGSGRFGLGGGGGGGGSGVPMVNTGAGAGAGQDGGGMGAAGRTYGSTGYFRGIDGIPNTGGGGGGGNMGEDGGKGGSGVIIIKYWA